MLGNVTAAEVLARHRAADLDRRNELRRRRSEWSRPTSEQRTVAVGPAVAPSAPALSATLAHTLRVSRPHAAR